jgi:CBS domain-containing protein
MSYQIKEYMNRKVVTVDSGSTAVESSEIMQNNRVGYLIVLERGQPIGIVTERDFVWKVIAKKLDPLKIKVFEFMSAPLISVTPEVSVEDAIMTTAKHNIRKLPVVQDNIIHGIFTTRDLTRQFKEHQDRILKDIMNAQNLYGSSIDYM